MDDFADRGGHEARGIHRDFVFDASREALGQRLHRRIDLLRNIQRIGTRLLVDRNHRRLFAVINIAQRVILAPEVGPRHILQADD